MNSELMYAGVGKSSRKLPFYDHLLHSSIYYKQAAVENSHIIAALTILTNPQEERDANNPTNSSKLVNATLSSI